MFVSKMSKGLGTCLKKLWLITDKLSSQKVISEHFAHVGQKGLKHFNLTQANKEKLTFFLVHTMTILLICKFDKRKQIVM
jgi:hypothetical protein